MKEHVNHGFLILGQNSGPGAVPSVWPWSTLPSVAPTARLMTLASWEPITAKGAPTLALHTGENANKISSNWPVPCVNQIINLSVATTARPMIQRATCLATTATYITMLGPQPPWFCLIMKENARIKNSAKRQFSSGQHKQAQEGCANLQVLILRKHD